MKLRQTKGLNKHLTKQAYEKMVNIINTQGNANSNHSSVRMANTTTKPKTNLTLPNAGEDVEQLELSDTIGRNTKWKTVSFLLS